MARPTCIKTKEMGTLAQVHRQPVISKNVEIRERNNAAVSAVAGRLVIRTFVGVIGRWERMTWWRCFCPGTAGSLPARGNLLVGKDEEPRKNEEPGKNEEPAGSRRSQAWERRAPARLGAICFLMPALRLLPLRGTGSLRRTRPIREPMLSTLKPWQPRREFLRPATIDGRRRPRLGMKTMRRGQW